MPSILSNTPESWPSLPLNSWENTRATLHMWTQIVGKIRMALTPLVNHYWNVPLYVSARGLTTSRIPYGERTFELYFDFIRHELICEVSDGSRTNVLLSPKSVAVFYREVMEMLRSLGIDVKIWRMPVEIPDPIPFDQDTDHDSYDAVSAARFWRILLSVDAVFEVFRSSFIGKSSPVHFFWGSFDLAVTRFSGRRAPERPGADAITREAYSHEVSSVGFWPGSLDVNSTGESIEAAFYSYAAPEPEGFKSQKIKPDSAYYRPKLNEFVLLYDDIRKGSSPSQALLDFCQSTYDSASTLGKWDRNALERSA